MNNATRILTAPFTRRARAELGYWLASIPLVVASVLFIVPMLVNGLLWGLSAPGVRKLAGGARVLALSCLGENIPAPGPLTRGTYVHVKTPDAARLAALVRAQGARVREHSDHVRIYRGRPASWIVDQAARENIAIHGLRDHPKLSRLSGALRDRYAWQARGYFGVKLLLAAVAVAVIGAFWLGALFCLTFPAWWRLAHGVPWLYGQHVAAAFALVPAGVALLLAAPWVTHAVTEADRSLIRALLWPPGSLAERVRDLEQTRAQAVDDSAARLRSIERDLHDGAQAQLVALSMKLGLAREKLYEGSDLARIIALVEDAHSSAVEAIAELRTLARGIHPPVLDHGLADALATLATRSAVPVELVTDIGERPSAAIETIAYFSAAELLANVAKHSEARHATVEAVHVPGLLRVRVTDDGHGGARLVPGGGLSGLAERVRTVDGHLDVDSPVGGPTTVTVELPSHA